MQTQNTTKPSIIILDSALQDLHRIMNPTWFDNVKSKYRTVRRFIRNVYWFRRALSEYEDWDNLYMYEFLFTHLEILERELTRYDTKYGPNYSSGSHYPFHRKIELAMMAVRRLKDADDAYYNNLRVNGHWPPGPSCDTETIKYLFNLVRKYGGYWWT